MTRYMYWRMPDGKRYKELDDKHAPTTLLAELGRSAQINEEGNVQWKGFVLLRYEAGIRSSAMIIDPQGRELNENDTWSIVRSAIVASIKKKGGQKPVLPRDVVHAADRSAGEFFRSGVKKYLLITSMSLKSFPSKRLFIGGSEIRPIRQRGSRYPIPDVIRFQNRASPIAKHASSTRYQLVRVTTSGRSVNEAVESGIDSISLLRGLWNLFATYGKWSFGFGASERNPLGVVHGGPVFTLHNIDGSLVDNIFWFEPNPGDDFELFSPEKGWDALESARRRSMRQMVRHSYRNDLESLIRRYASALDSSDFNIAFLSMWSVLERITDTVNARYDETIRRATWIFRDREIAAELLQCVRLRNLYVHAATSGEDREQIAYMIKAFVDPHLLRLIRNDFRVSSLHEYGGYLDTSRSIEHLERESKRLSRVARMLKRWEDSESHQSK